MEDVGAIESVESFLEHAYRRYFAEPRGHWVFRGHCDSRYNLCPSVGRGEHQANSRKDYEKNLFEAFQRDLVKRNFICNSISAICN